MKNNLRTIIIIAVCGVIFGGAANAFAQTGEPVVGGYGKVAATDQEVVAAANFAVRAQAKKQRAKIKLTAVNAAARQVVAGVNYQICLSVQTTDRRTKKATPQTVQAIVYKNLKQKYSLTNWTIAACADAAPMPPVN